MPLDLYTHVREKARDYAAEHSARQLAEAAGCDHGQVVRWLYDDKKRHREPKAQTFCRLAAALGLKVKGGAK